MARLMLARHKLHHWYRAVCVRMRMSVLACVLSTKLPSIAW